GSIVGTVVDVNGDTVPGATVVLVADDANDRRTVTANENGYFELHDVKPGIPYQVKINAAGFSEWNSPPIILQPSQFKILADIRLQLELARTTINVTQTSEEVATEQVKVEETQRVLGIIPNFYVVYDPEPAPLTAKLKFRLALKVATDPITATGIAFLSAVQQAGDTPDYGQGAEGFGKRYGANAADGFTDIMIGGAILPSLLHQDPRYFYQGTGTKKSRVGHALFHPFVCKGDNGKWQANFSSLGGDLGSSAISNLYYPQSNRGAGLVFMNFAISTAERVATSLAQEFVIPQIRSPRHASK
ncbi:MAG TPA: carboxypeptidase-like regulatory domain-containing protein, partial [Terriglobales bacterium]|nr:carboxypeptidase-like regulatory domain-containing protein [Terriglobales bacterium]